MLRRLTIENIAVIERADIEFGAGLCVLTGETGAGKSILIDAIHAVMGERTSRELIRTGADRAMVSALFSDCHEAVSACLQELGFEPEEAMAIGDGSNDLDMVSASGTGVAMENAIEELKAAARYITGNNNACGFAEAVRKFVLK